MESVFLFIISPSMVWVWEFVEALTIIAVAIGCWGESWVEHHKFKDDPSSLFSIEEKRKTYKRRFEKTVWISLAIEFFAFGLAVFGSNEAIANLKRDAEALRLRADQLEAQLLRERFERDRMTLSSLPRTLNSLRYPEFVDRLRKFAGTKFFVVTLTDIEAIRLGRRIEDLLVAAGWEKEPMVKYPEADESQIPDLVWIESNGPIVGPPESPLRPAMDALVDALTDSRIAANRSFLNPRLPPNKLPPNTIRVVIGLNPNWYFRDKKFQQEAARERVVGHSVMGPPSGEKVNPTIR